MSDKTETTIALARTAKAGEHDVFRVTINSEDGRHLAVEFPIAHLGDLISGSRVAVEVIRSREKSDARVAELEAAIREHKKAAINGRSPSALKFADHRKLWSLLPD